MIAAEAAAQDQLRLVAEDLADLRMRLQGIRSSLPETPDEGELDDEDGPRDLAAVLRSVIDCVLTDSLEPAIRDLQAAAALRDPAEEAEERL